jgi:hypothetical protein
MRQVTDQPRGEYIRAKHAERGSTRRKRQDRCNRLKLRFIQPYIRVVYHSSYFANAWTICSNKVSPIGEEDSVLFEHSVHRLVLATNRDPVEPKSNGKLLSRSSDPERSPKAEADFVLAEDVDKSFKPLGFSMRLDDYGVTWSENSAYRALAGLNNPTFENTGTFLRKPRHCQTVYYLGHSNDEE